MTPNSIFLSDDKLSVGIWYDSALFKHFEIDPQATFSFDLQTLTSMRNAKITSQSISSALSNGRITVRVSPPRDIRRIESATHALKIGKNTYEFSIEQKKVDLPPPKSRGISVSREVTISTVVIS